MLSRHRLFPAPILIQPDLLQKQADIKTLVLVGGGVRVPAIKAKLEDTVGA